MSGRERRWQDRLSLACSPGYRTVRQASHDLTKRSGITPIWTASQALVELLPTSSCLRRNHCVRPVHLEIRQVIPLHEHLLRCREWQARVVRSPICRLGRIIEQHVLARRDLSGPGEDGNEAIFAFELQAVEPVGCQAPGQRQVGRARHRGRWRGQVASFAQPEVDERSWKARMRPGSSRSSRVRPCHWDKPGHQHSRCND